MNVGRKKLLVCQKNVAAFWCCGKVLYYQQTVYVFFIQYIKISPFVVLSLFIELQDDDSTTSNRSRHQNAPPVSSEYEALDEPQFSGMFSNLGSPLKRSQLVSRSMSNKQDNNVVAKANADYEVITQFENVANNPSRQTPPSNDYEEIITEKRNQSPRRRPKIDEYADINDISGIDFKF